MKKNRANFKFMRIAMAIHFSTKSAHDCRTKKQGVAKAIKNAEYAEAGA